MVKKAGLDRNIAHENRLLLQGANPVYNEKWAPPLFHHCNLHVRSCHSRVRTDFKNHSFIKFNVCNIIIYIWLQNVKKIMTMYNGAIHVWIKQSYDIEKRR